MGWFSSTKKEIETPSLSLPRLPKPPMPVAPLPAPPIPNKVQETEPELPKPSPPNDLVSTLNFDAEDESLWIANGITVHSVAELAKAIKLMDDKTFHMHVTKTKNEFADWIIDIDNNKMLADKFRKAKKRVQAYNILERELGLPIIKKAKAHKETIPTTKPQVEVALKEAAKLAKEEPAFKQSIIKEESLAQLELENYDFELPMVIEKPKKNFRENTLLGFKQILTAFKPAVDVVSKPGNPVKRETKPNTPISKTIQEIQKEDLKIEIETPKSEINIALDSVKSNKIDPLPKIKPGKIKFKNASEITPEKLKKMSIKKQVEFTQNEVKRLCDLAKNALDSNHVDEASKLIKEAKIVFRKTPTKEMHKLLDYTISELETEAKIAAL